MSDSSRVFAGVGLVLGLILMIGAAASADGLRVGNVEFPVLRWGTQQAQVEVTNTTDYVRFVVAEIELKFAGSYLNPERRMRSFFALPPGETDTIRPSLMVPGNYGTAQTMLRLYDVVDTLDDVLPSQKFFEQPFTLRFHVPEALQARFETRISLPPRVEEHPYFDNEFSRLMLVLLAEGKSPEEIAALAECDVSFVNQQIDLIAGEQYLKRIEGTVQLLVPVIRQAEAEAARAKAMKLADTLAAIIAGNLPKLAAVRDELIKANRMTADSGAFYDGGTVLFDRYPTVGALALWWEMGRKFITRAAPLWIYDGTDICNARIPTYMYVVEGGNFVNGHQFYAPTATQTALEINFGDTIPKIKCDPEFIRWIGNPGMVSHTTTDEFAPKNYMVDTSVVRPAVEAIASGTDSVLASAYTELRDMAVDTYGHERLDYGYRYWFWNLTATRVLELLRERGEVTRIGNGQYRLTGMESGS